MGRGGARPGHCWGRGRPSTASRASSEPRAPRGDRNKRQRPVVGGLHFEEACPAPVDAGRVLRLEAELAISTGQCRGPPDRPVTSCPPEPEDEGLLGGAAGIPARPGALGGQERLALAVEHHIRLEGGRQLPSPPTRIGRPRPARPLGQGHAGGGEAEKGVVRASAGTSDRNRSAQHSGRRFGVERMGC